MIDEYDLDITQQIDKNYWTIVLLCDLEIDEKVICTRSGHSFIQIDNDYHLMLSLDNIEYFD